MEHLVYDLRCAVVSGDDCPQFIGYVSLRHCFVVFSVLARFVERSKRRQLPLHALFARWWSKWYVCGEEEGREESGKSETLRVYLADAAGETEFRGK